MQIPINLSDALLEDVVTEANARDLNPERVILDHLALGMQIPVGVRTVFLSGAPLRALEDKLGHGMITSGEDLATKVDRLAKIEFGGHEIRLSQAQREELVWRAKKRGVTLEQMVEDTWRRMESEFFTMALGVLAQK